MAGYLTGFAPLQTAVLETVTWLPLTLLCARRFAKDPTTHWAALTALALGLAFLGGHPQTFVFVALLTLAYFVYALIPSAERPISKTALILLLAGVSLLTTALIAIQLLPTLEFIFNSTRVSVPFDQAAAGLAYPDILQFFLTGVVTHWQTLYAALILIIRPFLIYR